MLLLLNGESKNKLIKINIITAVMIPISTGKELRELCKGFWQRYLRIDDVFLWPLFLIQFNQLMDSWYSTTRADTRPRSFLKQSQMENVAFSHLNQGSDKFYKHSCDDRNAFEIWTQTNLIINFQLHSMN